MSTLEKIISLLQEMPEQTLESLYNFICSICTCQDTMDIEKNVIQPKREIYTSQDYWTLPEGQRAELIDGKMYPMAMPNRIHQQLVGQLCFTIGRFIDLYTPTCEVIHSPFAVNLTGDEQTWVEPDVIVIYNKDKLSERACESVPDWIIEITSPESYWMDYYIKLFKYNTAGVREYWIINPMKNVVQTYVFEWKEKSDVYSFDDEIPVHTLKNIYIRISDLL